MLSVVFLENTNILYERRMRVDKIIIIFIAYIFVYKAYTQNLKSKSPIYFLFDRSSKEKCKIFNEGFYEKGDSIEIKKYQKITQRDGDIEFYICKERFYCRKSSVKDTIDISYLKQIELMSVGTIMEMIKNNKIIKDKKDIISIIPYRHNDLFGERKVYFLEREKNNKLVRYSVVWAWYMDCWGSQLYDDLINNGMCKELAISKDGSTL